MLMYHTVYSIILDVIPKIKSMLSCSAICNDLIWLDLVWYLKKEWSNVCKIYMDKSLILEWLQIVPSSWPGQMSKTVFLQWLILCLSYRNVTYMIMIMFSNSEPSFWLTRIFAVGSSRRSCIGSRLEIIEIIWNYYHITKLLPADELIKVWKLSKQGHGHHKVQCLF